MTQKKKKDEQFHELSVLSMNLSNYEYLTNKSIYLL